MLLLLTLLATFGLDIASKRLALTLLAEGNTRVLLPGVFHLTLVKNRGAAFGLFPNQTQFFVTATLLVLIGGIYFAWTYARGRPAVQVALGLLLGGAAGNLVDRIWRGYVVDFIDFRIWPVFNLADTAVVAGVIFFALVTLREGKLG